uniref:Major facilitator superfamily (MFS) profile domain-containing protein n=1 Tax=Leptocylindrus danicus TaxID=163516 RepID=A0A7S2KSF4_9STRA|mmetsp:Transcript_25564/g.38166  ORF Transcript_25564/g.38166 Transcript_25564/m.38166 type:complete len:547 (+) Transcript_25564:182-1822(+)|eukprot:CAMPEP_0116020374 /NCGR_PEP_ID=MMETSP0321-20121206/9757_1 /TAXON_ID=163516 /ORGANISM="Leptocylindrus danicus var. danicus, Strain B650" /LENGTH=546 /DNA_ID=CAMNT_0003491049 /DNA_START=173 /DNA_END=1813 /DNA_ORIENTATION=+
MQRKNNSSTQLTRSGSKKSFYGAAATFDSCRSLNTLQMFNTMSKANSSSSLQMLHQHTDYGHTTCKGQPPGSVTKTPLMKTIAGVVGNILEWYDFAVFGYFSDIIASNFFPPQDGNAALIESFAVFGAAFIMRPIGGAMMGYIGDKFGAQKALEISVFLMAFPTFAMGCLPTYSQVGILSPILLIIVRMLQGFSVGGQLMSSLVFTLERQPREHWGLYGSFVLAAANVGVLLGGLMGYFLHNSLTDEALRAWGWRIPFWMGILVSISGFYLRNHADQIHGAAAPDSNPVMDAFKPENRRSLCAASLVTMLWSGGFYVSFVWMAVFMNDLVEPPVPGAYGMNSMSLFLSVVLPFPFIGILADKFGSTNVMRAGGKLMLIFGPIMVMIIGTSGGGGHFASILLAQSSLGLFLSLWGAPMSAWLVESFPPEVRLTSVSIGYNIAQATIGGFSPGIATCLADTVGPNSPGYFLSFLAILSLVGLYIAPDHAPPPLLLHDSNHISMDLVHDYNASDAVADIEPVPSMDTADNEYNEHQHVDLDVSDVEARV